MRSTLLARSLFGEAVDNYELAAYLSNEGTLLAVNLAVTELTGYTYEELMSGSMPSIDADDATQATRADDDRGRSNGRGRIRRKDGTIVGVGFLIARTRVARDTLTLGLLWADA